jgi:Ca2+-binding RTX toxin-like protein
MANITGTTGNDTLAGTSADDVIQGLDGNDNLTGGAGNDRLEGGAGIDTMNGNDGNDLLIGGADGDTLYDNSSGSDELEGGSGSDDIRIWRASGAAATTNRMDGGADNDFFGVYDESRASTFNLSGGDGNDSFWIRGAAAVSIDAGSGDDHIELEGVVAAISLNLGSGGADRIRINGQTYNSIGGSITATGFDTGNSGDSLDIAEFLNLYLTNWDYRTNPFATGHFRLVESGGNTLFQVDWNGGNNSYVTFITFVGTASSSLTAYNLGGWASDGSDPAGVNIVGDPWANDILTGGAGDDVIQGLGGGDTIRGGAGDDQLEGGTESDTIYGGFGDDVLEGGGGDDYLHADLRGLDVLRGGDGNDSLNYSRAGDETGWSELDGGAGDDYLNATGWQQRDDGPAVQTRIRLIGGDGADRIYIYRADEVEVNAGPGNDRIDLDTYTNARITLGTGSDVIKLDELRGFVFNGRTITITDFEGGDSGDRLDWSAYLSGALPTWDRASNPFPTYLRLVQSGADTLVQISSTGNVADFKTLMTLENVQASSLGQFNMGGFPPDGSPPAGVTMIGTPNPDQLTGGAGGDTIYGLGQNDTLRGGGGDDFLYGEEGNDDLNGELGNDRLEGGTGSDFLQDQSGGNDSLYGGAGRDYLYVARFDGPASTILLDGGADDDSLTYGGYTTTMAILATLTMIGGAGDDQINVGVRANATIDAGAGNDRLSIVTDAGQYSITLGTGSDEIELFSYNAATIGTIVVNDFQAALGDRLNLNRWFSSALSGWNGAVNPFDAGYARLVQSGSATLLQIDRDGGGNSYSTLLTLSNTSHFSMTSANLGGFDPVTRGTSEGEVMTGSSHGDLMDGGGGNDLLRMQQGGDDKAGGGGGNDVLYFGSAFTGGDIADGGEGRDALVLQGNYVLALSGFNLIGIESISLQSGANSTFGDTANNFYDFNLTTADGNVAPGQQLIVNAQSLRAGEDFTFDGSAETDGKFLIYGGHGVDDLTGGAGVDVFFFEGQRWGANDKVDGGAGRDALVISGGSGLTRIEFLADSLTNIESISVNNRYATDPSQKPSYELVLHNGNVAPGETLIVNGSSLPFGQVVNIDGRGVQGGNLILFGGGGHDILTGGDGNDTIQGGGGADGLTGGAGADTFRYDSASDSKPGLWDLIGDFQAGVDKIDLSRIDANTHAGGDQAFTWIGANAFGGAGAASAGELRVYQDNGYQRVEGDTDGDGSADLVILFQIGTALLAQGDFLI